LRHGDPPTGGVLNPDSWGFYTRRTATGLTVSTRLRRDGAVILRRCGFPPEIISLTAGLGGRFQNGISPY